MKKSILKTAGIVAFALLGMTSCSSDDSNGGNGNRSIDAAVGTFKGTFEPVGSEGPTHFNATLIVTKVSNTELRVAPKTGEAYSNYTPKTIKVYNDTQGILNDGATPEGSFIYALSSKTLDVLTKEQAETDITFRFTGTKQ